MSPELAVLIRSEADIVEARQRGRSMAAELGLSPTNSTLVATAISEVARNILTYAKHGEILLTHVADAQGRRGIMIVARDEGPGIEHLELALTDGYSTGKGLGLGLPGAKRLMDEFAVQSALGKGTTVTMKKWVSR